MRVDEFEPWATAAADRLYRAALLLVHDVPLAQDLVQDTLERVLKKWREVDDPYAFAHVTLTRLVIDHWRRRARRGEELRSEIPDLSVGLEAFSPAWYDLQVCLARLPRAQQQVVVLRYVLDASEVQTAVALGITTGTVKSHASRGLARMRAELEEKEPEPWS